jgi:2-polyprenyl-3-methyl-5-hydroxy-6-metoxy-1,4-benzoquinol methylase
MIIKRTLRFAELIRQYERQEGVLSAPVEAVNAGDDNVSAYEKNGGPDIPSLQEEPPVRLNELRYRAITDVVTGLPLKRRIVDMGAGEGKLSAKLAYIPGVESILAVEPSGQSRLRAMERFAKLEGRSGIAVMPEPVIGSLFYFDEQLQNQDVMILCEVIEHIEAYRLNGIMDTIMNEYQPGVLLVTTPNKEYNQVYAMEQESLRHHDHRFEWTRAELATQCEMWTKQAEYTFEIRGIGEYVEGFGQPTQLVIFRKERRDQHEG